MEGIGSERGRPQRSELWERGLGRDLGEGPCGEVTLVLHGELEVRKAEGGLSRGWGQVGDPWRRSLEGYGECGEVRVELHGDQRGPGRRREGVRGLGKRGPGERGQEGSTGSAWGLGEEEGVFVREVKEGPGDTGVAEQREQGFGGESKVGTGRGGACERAVGYRHSDSGGMADRKILD